jgi:hypothetical protein
MDQEGFGWIPDWVYVVLQVQELHARLRGWNFFIQTENGVFQHYRRYPDPSNVVAAIDSQSSGNR